MLQDRSFRLTDRDRAVLGPLAEHRILIAPQVAVLLGVNEETASRRLNRLKAHGLIRYRRIIDGGPGGASITEQGLRRLGNRGGVPTDNAGAYRHDVGTGWLWLGARNGAFGALRSVTTERELRIADKAGRRTPEGSPHGFGLGLLGPHGHPQRHYPDLLLHTDSGHQVAVELELTAKSRQRMSRIMTAYASDPRIDAVVYLVPTQHLATLVSDAARRAGISDLIDIRMVAGDRIDGVGEDVARSRAPSRTSVTSGRRQSALREQSAERGAAR
jgi:hypothetical protein